jgi:hypothetical protein
MEDVADTVWEIAAAEWAKTHVPSLGRLANPEESAIFAKSPVYAGTGFDNIRNMIAPVPAY